MNALTDVEISRALNALSTTLRDQRPERFDAARCERIVLGALANEPKLRALATGAESGELHRREDDRLIATIERTDGQWTVIRKMRAGESDWALPEPAHAEQSARDESAGEDEE
jgi:hypothetical protein